MEKKLPKNVHLAIKHTKIRGEWYENTFVTSSLKDKLLLESSVVVDILKKKVVKNRLTGKRDDVTAEFYISQNLKHIKKFFAEYYDVDFVVGDE